MNIPSLISRLFVACAKCAMLLVACIAFNAVVFAVRDETIALPFFGAFDEVATPKLFYASIAGCIALATASFAFAAWGFRRKA